MEIDIGNIPKGKNCSDYPTGTIFVLEEDKRPKRDPETGLLILQDNHLSDGGDDDG